MICQTIFDLRNRLLPGQRVLGLDYGEARTGFAISDRNFKVASPLKQVTSRSSKELVKAVFETSEDWRAGGLVIGLPINMDGSEGERCRSTHRFCAHLLNSYDMPILLQDERLSTSAIERVLIEEADLSRAKRKTVIDKMAACYILQGALDLLNGGTL